MTSQTLEGDIVPRSHQFHDLESLTKIQPQPDPRSTKLETVREVVGGDKNAETEKLDVDAPEIQDQIPRVQLLDLI
nr:hypothetical protein Itr_chr06CG11250 [Ipomoea trifida]